MSFSEIDRKVSPEAYQSWGDPLSTGEITATQMIFEKLAR
jgi:hypothetical protein